MFLKYFQFFESFSDEKQPWTTKYGVYILAGLSLITCVIVLYLVYKNCCFGKKKFQKKIMIPEISTIPSGSEDANENENKVIV